MKPRTAEWLFTVAVGALLLGAAIVAGIYAFGGVE